MTLHKVRITSPEGRGVLTTVTVDGQELRGVTLVALEVDVDHLVQLTIGLYADLEFEGEAEITKQWRTALPWWRRLRRVFLR